MKKDIYISILKHGVETGLSIVQENEIYEVATKEGFLTQIELDNLIKGENIIDEVLEKKKYILLKIFEDNFEYVQINDKYAGRRLTTEAYFKYIEFIELSESRISSKEARKYSLIALMVSVLAIVVSSFFAFLQLNNPVEIIKPIRIEDNQIKKMYEKFDKIETKIDTLQFNLYKVSNTKK